MNDDDFLKQIKHALDQQSESLDGETLSRLNRARQAAIQQADKKRSRLMWLPATGLVAALLLTSLFLFRSDDIDMIQNGNIDEIELIASSEQLELLEQLEFYQWLLEEDADAV